MFVFLRHNIIELIETEKEYVKDLALIVEVGGKKTKRLICTENKFELNVSSRVT